MSDPTLTDAERKRKPQPGDVISWWHDTGAFGVTPCYATVLSGDRMLTVLTEFGSRLRKSRHFFTRGVITGSELEDFRRETKGGLRKMAQPNPFAAVEEIAQRKLNLLTLETRGRDCLDFPQNIAVWQLREALFIAFVMGREGKTLDEAQDIYAEAVAP